MYAKIPPDIESIKVSDAITLYAANECFVSELYQLVLKNRDWLQQSLDWPQHVSSEADSRQNMLSNVMLHQRGYAKMFVIVCEGDMAGVLSFNAIEPQNKAGYIGYWLDEQRQGKGILSACLQAFINYYAEKGEVRRFVIKCRTANAASNRVAQRNGFALEGCLRQAEYLNGAFHDQNIYARIVDNTPARS
ncbi:50S ribosomal protein L7/L12-serine acetyltransferase [Pluralibacter gergoviae]|nr:50S ribosomal protein L7/L12-serine acetyltransferase [Pluralibacter gergoviae]EMD1655923.1 50S ribosomal protein L7/L12-serine acetyltransferase [Pluralibacter gergoviae]